LLVPSAAMVMLAGIADADPGFYERFSQASEIQKGFLWDSDLITTNNPGPVLTNAPVPYSRFAEHGELAGIKLGMTMDEVVSAWGKPHALFTRCVFGPRFWYGSGPWYSCDFSLSFVSNRLVLIAIYGAVLQQIKFDNGLSGNMAETQCEKLLLNDARVRHASRRGRLYAGDLTYLAGKIRIDLGFTTTAPKGVRAPEHLWMMASSFEHEATLKTHAGQQENPENAEEHAFGMTNTVVAPGVFYVTTPANLTCISNAVKVAAGLRAGMSRAEVDTYMWDRGMVLTNNFSLSLDRGRTTSCFYALTDSTSLVLEMSSSTDARIPGVEPRNSVLDAAYIKSGDAKFISITLTNAP
jgi:hypothetical protein